MALTDMEIRNKVQIIHCSRRKHWIVATTVNCKEGEVKTYDLVFDSCDNEVELAVRQKQVGGKDCGVHSIAFATAIVLGLNPGKATFLQHVINVH